MKKDWGIFWGIVAVMLSWVTNHSVLWAILHGILGGFYVAYWLIVHVLVRYL